MREQEGVTEEDVREFERSAILMKAMDVVRQRAHQQSSIRSSNGKSYGHVKSKVARCLKVQKKVAKANKKQKKEDFVLAQSDE